MSDARPAAAHDASLSVGDSLTAGDIADLVDGELHGDPTVAVSAVAPLSRATAGELSFLASPRYVDAASSTLASVLLVAPEFADVDTTAAVRIVVGRPHEAVLALLPRLYRQPPRRPGIDPTARIGQGVTLGEDVTVGAYAVIGEGAVIGDRGWIGEHCMVGAGVELGTDNRLFPHVTCYPGTRTGARVIVQSGARIGSDGFGYVYTDGEHRKIPHVGQCLLGDDVEVGANTTIDRGSIDDTVIGAGTKIDNLVQIGHNVKIGKLCLIISQAGISGSCHIGDGCVIAGQAGLSGHLTIGAGAQIAAQAGVFGDVPAGERWSGYPARPHRESLRGAAALRRLPALLRELDRAAAGGKQAPASGDESGESDGT